MCRYTTKAHAYGAYTVRDKYSGDILTFDFGSYLRAGTAQDDARRVCAALELAYNQGIERGAREQRDYTTDVLVAAAREAQALNEDDDISAEEYESWPGNQPAPDFTDELNKRIEDVGTAIKGGKSGYPSGNTDKSREIQERWRENNS